MLIENSINLNIKEKRYVTSSMNTLRILMLDIKNLILCHGTLYEDFIVFKNKVNYITSNRNVVTDTRIQALQCKRVTIMNP